MSSFLDSQPGLSAEEKEAAREFLRLAGQKGGRTRSLARNLKAKLSAAQKWRTRKARWGPSGLRPSAKQLAWEQAMMMPGWRPGAVNFPDNNQPNGKEKKS